MSIAFCFLPFRSECKRIRIGTPIVYLNPRSVLSNFKISVAQSSEFRRKCLFLTRRETLSTVGCKGEALRGEGIRGLLGPGEGRGEYERTISICLPRDVTPPYGSREVGYMLQRSTKRIANKRDSSWPYELSRTTLVLIFFFRGPLCGTGSYCKRAV